MSLFNNDFSLSILETLKAKKEKEKQFKSLQQYRDENGGNLLLSQNISVKSTGMHLVLGPSGCGKDRCHILPNVERFDHDMFFVENSSRLREFLEPHLKEHRYHILFFNKDNVENEEYRNDLVGKYESFVKEGVSVAVFAEVDDSIDPAFYEIFLKLLYAKRAQIFRALEGTKDEGAVRRAHFYMNDVFPYFCIGTFYYIIETCQLDNAGFSILSQELEDIETAFEVEEWFQSFVSHCKTVTIMGSFGLLTEPIFRRANLNTPDKFEWNLPAEECSVHIRGEEFVNDTKIYGMLKETR